MNKIKEQLDNIFAILNQENPNPKIELNYSNDFELLVAIILSAQTTDILVNRATEKLYKIANTPQKILDLGLDELLNYLSILNLYKTKTKHIIETSKIIVEKYDSKVPRNFEDLIKLPGVGRKTANVFLNTFYGDFRIGIDTHIARVTQKLGISETNNVLIIEKILMENISEKWKKHSHHLLVLHGRYVCTAKKPKCEICSINKFCKYYISIKK